MEGIHWLIHHTPSQVVEASESHTMNLLLIHQILPEVMETTGGSSKCHVRNSLCNSLGIISSNEDRHAKI